MTNLKIESANRPAIEATLLEVNENATAHTLTDFGDLERLAEDLEQKVVNLAGSNGPAISARAIYTSGKSVANAYSYKRVATEVIVERRNAAWYLTSAKRVQVSTRGGGEPRLFLLPEQDHGAPSPQA
jgi:hypothetical protein